MSNLLTDGACYILVATKVIAEKPLLHLARPIHVGDNLPCQTAAFGILRMRRAWSVGGYEKTVWPRLADCRENARAVFSGRLKMMNKTGGV